MPTLCKLGAVLITLALASCTTPGSDTVKAPTPAVQQPAPPPAFDLALIPACLGKMHNRGPVKPGFMKDAVEWAQRESADVFEVNSGADIYSSVAPQLGPFSPGANRRAAMVEILRVLGGFESSWDYDEGRDMSANNTSDCTIEAGIFQTSGNAKSFSPGLKALQIQYCGSDACAVFKTCSKDETKKAFIFGFTARLLRVTILHHGPAKRKEINNFLSRNCMKQLEVFFN